MNVNLGTKELLNDGGMDFTSVYKVLLKRNETGAKPIPFNLTVKPHNENDVPLDEVRSILRLDNPSIPGDIGLLLMPGDEHFLLQEVEDPRKIFGFALVQHEPLTSYDDDAEETDMFAALRAIYILPEYRRQGLGKILAGEVAKKIVMLSSCIFTEEWYEEVESIDVVVGGIESEWGGGRKCAEEFARNIKALFKAKGKEAFTRLQISFEEIEAKKPLFNYHKYPFATPFERQLEESGGYLSEILAENRVVYSRVRGSSFRGLDSTEYHLITIPPQEHLVNLDSLESVLRLNKSKGNAEEHEVYINPYGEYIILVDALNPFKVYGFAELSYIESFDEEQYEFDVRMDSIYVVPAYRRKGFGRILCREAARLMTRERFFNLAEKDFDVKVALSVRGEAASEGGYECINELGEELYRLFQMENYEVKCELDIT